MERFRGKYSIKSPRASNWDYTSAGNYFVTINTHNRHCAFGEITNEVMKLSINGEWANKYWKEIVDHFNNVRLDEFVIMPDHIHGIIHLDSIVETLHATSLPTNYEGSSQSMSDISPKKGSLGVIIRSFKSACTKKFNEIDPNSWFGWQPLYHDQILGSKKELESRQRYIRNNVRKWKGN